MSELVECFIEVGIGLMVALSRRNHGNGSVPFDGFSYLARIVSLVRHDRLRSAVLEKLVCHREIADIARCEQELGRISVSIASGMEFRSVSSARLSNSLFLLGRPGCPCRVLMDLNVGRIDEAPFVVEFSTQQFENLTPQALLGPTIEKTKNSRPRTKFSRKISPRCSCSQSPQNPFNSQSQIPNPLNSSSHQNWFQSIPDRIWHRCPEHFHLRALKSRRTEVDLC